MLSLSFVGVAVIVVAVVAVVVAAVVVLLVLLLLLLMMPSVSSVSARGGGGGVAIPANHILLAQQGQACHFHRQSHSAGCSTKFVLLFFFLRKERHRYE